MCISLRQRAHLVKYPKGGSKMDPVTLMVLAAFAVSLIIIPGCMAASGSNTPIRDFILGASLVPTLMVYGAAAFLLLDHLPDWLVNSQDHWVLNGVFLMVYFTAVPIFGGWLIYKFERVLEN